MSDGSGSEANPKPASKSKTASKSPLSYQEQVAAQRTEKVREMLKALPAPCADFIRGITLTTSPLTRMAYTIDLGVFFDYLVKKSRFCLQNALTAGGSGPDRLTAGCCKAMPIT